MRLRVESGLGSLRHPSATREHHARHPARWGWTASDRSVSAEATTRPVTPLAIHARTFEAAAPQVGETACSKAVLTKRFTVAITPVGSCSRFSYCDSKFFARSS